MGAAAAVLLYAWGTIIANEVKIYSFPCSVKITFSSIKTSSINIVRGPGAIPGSQIKKYSFCREVAERAGWFFPPALHRCCCSEGDWRLGEVAFFSGWWKRGRWTSFPRRRDQEVRAVMDDSRCGRAKYEVGIKMEQRDFLWRLFLWEVTMFSVIITFSVYEISQTWKNTPSQPAHSF